MQYLLYEGAATPRWCLVHTECTCESTGCNKRTCTTQTCTLNRGDVCPKHCWAQVCVKAKVDPFSVGV